MAQAKWYPGHMVATQRVIRDLAPYLTAFVEVADARAPEISRHAPMTQWLGRAKRLLLLNKADLAEPSVTQAWVRYYQKQGISALAVTAQDAKARKHVENFISQILQPPFRLAVVGVPNVGKSTILNRMVGKNRVATGAKPGVTRGPQWIRMPGGWEWLDLPGVVTPAHSQDWRLMVLGIVPAAPEERSELADKIWSLLVDEQNPNGWLEWGKGRGYLSPGGGVDAQRAADAVLLAFQNGKLGRLSLDRPEKIL